MPLLSLNGVTKYFGADKALDNVSISIEPYDRVGLVGRNGGGKTTLLNIMARVLEPDDGVLSVMSGARLGMMKQGTDFIAEMSVWDHVRSAFDQVHALEARLRMLEARMEDATAHAQDLESTLASYAKTEEAYRRLGGYEWEVSASAVLTNLGFTTSEFTQKMDNLSSGQRVRAALARALLEQPDLLLLDEPTNHLDVHAAEWLENRIKSFEGAVVAVSHDKFFLNAVCNRIAELDDNALTEYKGNYDAYRQQREFKLQQQEREYERTAQKAEQLKDYIRRYKAGERARMARSREKWLKRIGPVRAPKAHRHLKFAFGPSETLGKTAFRIEGLSKKYSNHTVFSNIELSIPANDRLGIIGKNGAGKTTLIKLLTGIEDPTEGKVWVGPSVSVGHFRQDLDMLDPKSSVLDELMRDTVLLPGEARSVLGRFLFSGDDVYKEVSVLSGGEKNRLALAKLVVSGNNVLMLDEPTNHLDIESKEALAAALKAFGGAIVFITHDRQFLQECATRIFEIEDGRGTLYKGNYAFYREEKERAIQASEPRRVAEDKPKEKRTPAVGKGDPIRRKLRRQAHERALEAVQTSIEEHEARKAEIEARLADPETYLNDGAVAVMAEYRQVQAELEQKYAQWEALESETPE